MCGYLLRKHANLALAIATCTLVLGLVLQRTVAAEPKKPPAGVGPCICYEVEPQWPQRPPAFVWGQMPGVAVSDRDEVYAFTRAKPPIQVYDRQGKLLRAWGEREIGNAHYVRLDHQGNVWVADIGHHVVMQFTPQGKLLKTLGTRGQPGEDATHLNKPTDMAVAPDGQVFVSDGYGNNRVVHFGADGRFIKAWGKAGAAPGQFDLPHSIVRDSRGRLYVADRSNARVQVFDASGKFLDQWRDLLIPWGLTITKNDEIWACGSSCMRNDPNGGMLSCPPKDQVLMRFAPSGKLLQFWTLPKGADGKEQPGEVNWLHAVAIDSHGDLYVGDIQGKRAQKLVRVK
jgi:hypothetical protein